MASVTQRIREVKQPYGGYLGWKEMEKIVLEDGRELCDSENISASLVGTVVDILARCLLGGNKGEAFKVSMLGANLVGNQEWHKAFSKLDGIKGLDYNSIYLACQLVGYESCVRGGVDYVNVETIQANEGTIKNIQTMVQRSLEFLDKYGPVTKFGFTMDGGYTGEVDRGDGDYLTSDTLWDFKVIKGNPTSKDTLQLLMYYIMGKHSVVKEFQSLQKIGLYNPRLNVVYIYDMNKFSNSLYQEIEKKVIGYR